MTQSPEPQIPVFRSGDEITDWRLGRIRPTPTHVPNGWELVPINSVAKLESGHTPSRNQPKYWNGGIPWISLHDSKRLDVREMFDTGLTVSSLGLDNSSARLLPKGTVIFSRTATIGKSTVMGRDMATSQDFANYVCGPRLHNHFLVYVFRYMQQEWQSLMAGSTHNTIYMPIFKKLQVLLPPIEEQRAIAEALGDVDALINALDALITKKRHIKQGTMQQLLTGKKRLPGIHRDDKADQFVQTDIGLLPRDWRIRRLDQYGNVTSGTTPSRSQHEKYFAAGTIEWVKTTDLNNSYIQETEERVTERALADTCLRRLPSGTVLVAMYGGFKQIGRTGLLRMSAVINQALSAVDLDANQLNAEYLLYYLNYNVGRWRQIASSSRKDPNITGKDVKRFLVAAPQLEEQQAISAVLSDMESDIAALEQKRDKTKLIKQGMMQELLTGKTRLIGPEGTP